MNSEKETDSMKLDDLPYDILLNIFQSLDFKTLNQLVQVNKRLYTIANDNFLWKFKLLNDIRTWSLIDSKTCPKFLFQESASPKTSQEPVVNFKKVYMNACPIIVLKKEILEKLDTFQNAQTQLHLKSTSEDSVQNAPMPPPHNNNNNNNNITLSSLSSLVMPRLVLGQIRDFIYRNVFNANLSQETSQDTESIPKLIMFGPGLETTTSCLVTNILWKSDFKFIGMIPGRDGYGSGIKLKLFNHKPFNLTILYTNVSKVRQSNSSHDVNLNRLIASNQNNFELNAQVKEACSNASGFVYVVDNKHLCSLKANENLDPLDNYKLELNVLMKEVQADLPLLILGCSVSSEKSVSVSCFDIIEKLNLIELRQDWQIRNCDVFQPRLKDIMLGFEWMLGKLDQKILLKQTAKES